MAQVSRQSYAQPQVEDGFLIALAKSGDPTAYARLLARYKGFVRLKASSYFLAGGDSEDLIQEGLIGLYKAIRDYRTDRESSFRNFAELCITRQIITAVKTATRNKHTPLNHYVSFSSPAGAGADDDAPTLEEMIASPSVNDPAKSGDLIRGAALAGRLPLDLALAARVERARAVPRRALLRGDRRAPGLRHQDRRQRAAARQAQGRRAPRRARRDRLSPQRAPQRASTAQGRERVGEAAQRRPPWKPCVIRSLRAQFSSARSSASTRTGGRRRELARAPLDRHPVADREHPLGGEHHRVVLGQQQPGRRQRVAAQPPERDQQVVAGAAVQPRQREPLVDALEALLGRPARRRRSAPAAGFRSAARSGRRRRAPASRGAGSCAPRGPSLAPSSVGKLAGQGVATASIAANGCSLSSGPR